MFLILSDLLVYFLKVWIELLIKCINFDDTFPNTIHVNIAGNIWLYTKSELESAIFYIV